MLNEQKLKVIKSMKQGVLKQLTVTLRQVQICTLLEQLVSAGQDCWHTAPSPKIWNYKMYKYLSLHRSSILLTIH